MKTKNKILIGLGSLLIVGGIFWGYRNIPTQQTKNPAKKSIKIGVPRAMSIKGKIREAKKLLADAQFDKSALLLATVLKKNPNLIEPYQLLGEVYLQTKNPAKLDNLISQIQKKFPENSLANDLKIKKLIAEKKFREVLAITEKQDNLSDNLKFYQAVLLSLQNNHKKSREILTKLQKKLSDQESSELLEKVSGILKVYKNFDEFAEGKNPHLFALLAKNLAENNEAVLSKEFASIAIKEDPKYVDGWVLRGYAEYLMEDYPNALKDLRQAYDLDPSRPEVYYFLALTLEKNGNLAESALFFEKSLDFDFEFSREIRWKLINILIEQKKYDKVIELYKELAKNVPKNEEEKFVSAIYNLLNIVKNPQAAVDLAKILNENNPKNVLDLNLKAWSLIENNQLDEAEIVLEEVLKLSPKNPRTALNYGEFYEKSGDYSQAREWYKKSYEYGLGRGYDEIVNIAAEKFNALIDQENPAKISPNDKLNPSSP